MPHSFTKLLFHLVFATKRRAKDLTGDLRSSMLAKLEEIARNVGAQPLAVGAGLDHVHLLVRCPATLIVAELARSLKANSTRWARESGRPDFGWQNGYAAFTVSQSRAGEVASYVRDQQTRHQRVSFEDEFVSLLKRNEIEFENEHLWGGDTQGSRPGQDDMGAPQGLRPEEDGAGAGALETQGSRPGQGDGAV